MNKTMNTLQQSRTYDAKRLAYHEAGHALMAYLFGLHLRKVSIKKDEKNNRYGLTIFELPENSVFSATTATLRDVLVHMAGPMMEDIQSFNSPHYGLAWFYRCYNSQTPGSDGGTAHAAIAQLCAANPYLDECQVIKKAENLCRAILSDFHINNAITAQVNWLSQKGYDGAERTEIHENKIYENFGNVLSETNWKVTPVNGSESGGHCKRCVSAEAHQRINSLAKELGL